MTELDVRNSKSADGGDISAINNEHSIALTANEVKTLLSAGSVVIQRRFDNTANRELNPSKALTDLLNQMAELTPNGMKSSPYGAINQELAVLEPHRPIGWSYVDHDVTFEYSDHSTKMVEQLTDEQAEAGYFDYSYMDEICSELDKRGTPKINDENYDLSTEEGKPLWRDSERMPLWASRLSVCISDIGGTLVSDSDGEGCIQTTLTLTKV